MPEEISHPVFAALYDAMLPLGERMMRPHREYLAADLSGRVLDLGAGSGAMFSYVAGGREGSTTGGSDGDVGTSGEFEFHAVEPDPHMRRRAADAAREIGLAVDLRDGRAESLPYPDDAFDAVISGVVFCTIADPEAALDEVARVTKPGGEFRFLEHVRADGWRASGQDLLTPVWKRVAGGCHLNRDSVDRFVGHDAFDVIEVEGIDIGAFPAAPVVRGRLRRRRDGGLFE